MNIKCNKFLLEMNTNAVVRPFLINAGFKVLNLLNCSVSDNMRSNDLTLIFLSVYIFSLIARNRYMFTS